MGSCYPPGCCPPPYCVPCVPSCQVTPKVPPYTMTAYAIESMPQCGPPCPPATHRNVMVQQPPQLVSQKKVVYMNKVVQDPKLLYRVKPVAVPHVTEVMKIRRKPVLRWIAKVVDDPQVTWHSAYRPDPYVVCCPRTVMSPKEVCETLVCQPKPQVVSVPAPQEYSCYDTGPATLSGVPNFPKSNNCPILPPCLPAPCYPCVPRNQDKFGIPCVPFCRPYVSTNYYQCG